MTGADEVALITAIKPMGFAARIGWEAAHGPAHGVFVGQAADLVRWYGDTAEVRAFSLPNMSVIEIGFLRAAVGNLAEGLSFAIVTTFDRAGFEWRGEAIEAFASRFRIDLATAAPPDLPDGWTAALIERGRHVGG